MTKNTSATMTRRIGSTVFKVNIFTKEGGNETMEDKILYGENGADRKNMALLQVEAVSVVKIAKIQDTKFGLNFGVWHHRQIVV